HTPDRIRSAWEPREPHRSACVSRLDLLSMDWNFGGKPVDFVRCGQRADLDLSSVRAQLGSPARSARRGRSWGDSSNYSIPPPKEEGDSSGPRDSRRTAPAARFLKAPVSIWVQIRFGSAGPPLGVFSARAK